MAEDKWNVLLPREIDESGPDSIRDIANFVTVKEIGGREEDLIEHIGEFDAVILRMVNLTSEVLSVADNLKVIAKHGVGLDNVDIPAASERGIIVCNTPGANSRGIAEGAIGLLFAVSKNIITADAHVRDGEWERQKFVGTLLQGKTMGIYGCGNIGREAAILAHGIGMDCLSYDPYVRDDDVPDHVQLVDDKATLFERSDVVSVHSPLTDETRLSITMHELEELGESGILVNAARGAIVDEDDLISALRDGTIAGAGIDAFAEEPPTGSPLLEMDNVVLTPHTVGSTKEGRGRTARLAAENVREVYNGGAPESTVNLDDLQVHESP